MLYWFFLHRSVGQFFCMAMHTHSVTAFRELQSLSGAFDRTAQVLGTRDGIILGDLNVGKCGSVSLSEWANIPLWTSDHYHWFINEDESTSLVQPECSSDR